MPCPALGRPSRSATVALTVAAALAAPAVPAGAATAPVAPLALAAATAPPAALLSVRGTASAPSTPTVREFRLSELPGTRPGMQRARAAGDSKLVAVARPRPVSGYGVVGATWEGAWPKGLRFAVRTKVAAGRWTPWQTLHGGNCPCAACVARRAASGHGPDAGTAEFRNARPGTDAMAIGDVDSVQLRVSSPRGVVPEDLTLSVVDPETTVTAATAAGRDARPSRAGIRPRATATASTDVTTSSSSTTAAGTPQVLTRAQWGADERLRSGKPSYGTIKAGFVHHTVNANDYTRAEVPAIIRGIYAYHTRSRGWSDIGYNFLVDRFGRIWEGRYGGIDRPVIGAHTYGYNHTAFAMSAIGNFDVTEPPDPMLDAYGRLFAWKLDLHGIKAESTQDLGGKSFPAISAHRDAGQTACPGRYLYAQLPAIRTRAAGIQAAGGTTPPATTSPTPTPVYRRGADVARDLDGDGLSDLLGRDAATGQLQLLRGEPGPGFEPPRSARIRADRMDLLAGPGDVTGDGHPDLLTRVRRTGVTQLRPGRPTGLFGKPVPAADTTKFKGMDLLAGAGNIAGNRRPDLVGRDSRTGRLWVFQGKADGRWSSRRLLLAQAGALKSVAGAGDLNGDRRHDVLATVGRRLLLYPGLGRGQLGAPVVLSRRWGGRDLTVAGHDLTGDGVPDLVARDRATGRAWVYALQPNGRPGPRLRGPADWNSLAQVVAIGRVGTGRTRFLARTRSNELVVLDSGGTGWFAPSAETGRKMADANFVQLAGDWDGDGHADVLARTAGTGNVWLYPGLGDGRLGPRRRLWRGWTDRRDLVVLGDLTGDELPDLLARDPDGSIHVYPSDGAGGKQKRRLARGKLFATDLVAPAGYWNTDDVRDLIVRQKRNQRLYLVPGTTSGGLGKPVAVSDSFAAYDRIVGTGDVTGDGLPDVLATEKTTGRLWLFPGTATGLGPREYLSPDLSRFALLG
jgi:hypothetical protein